MDLFWEKAGWEKEDKHLVDLSLAPFNRPFPKIDVLKGPALFVLRGPRQVGKSSLLKTLLSQFPDPQSAFYLSCENIDEYQELSALLKSIRKTRKLILLDEVSFVKDWTRSIKHEIDSGYNGVIVVTGSHAADLRLGADQLPGRFGYGREFTLRPMSFSEFSAARKQAAWPELTRLEELRLYLQIGGMPSAVIESGSQGNIPEKALDTYERWLLGDALKLGKNKMFLQGLMAQLAQCSSTPVSLQTLAKKTEIASHHTVQQYIQFLDDTFAIRTCYALDADTGAFRFRKQKKYYFTDPIIFWIAVRMGGIPVPENWESQVAEMVGFEAIAQRSEKLRTRIGYYVDKNGEIDYFAPKQWAIELKWSPVAHNISNTFHKISVPEKIIWTMENFLADWPLNMR